MIVDLNIITVSCVLPGIIRLVRFSVSTRVLLFRAGLSFGWLRRTGFAHPGYSCCCTYSARLTIIVMFLPEYDIVIRNSAVLYMLIESEGY